VQVMDKNLVMSSSALAMAIKEEEQAMGDTGRILVRQSGTESLVRVMAEGRNMEQLKEIVGRLSNIISEIG
jgi:phosphoglucosamine mutase